MRGATSLQLEMIDVLRPLPGRSARPRLLHGRHQSRRHTRPLHRTRHDFFALPNLLLFRTSAPPTPDVHPAVLCGSAGPLQEKQKASACIRKLAEAETVPALQGLAPPPLQAPRTEAR